VSLKTKTIAMGRGKRRPVKIHQDTRDSNITQAFFAVEAIHSHRPGCTAGDQDPLDKTLRKFGYKAYADFKNYIDKCGGRSDSNRTNFEAVCVALSAWCTRIGDVTFKAEAFKPVTSFDFSDMDDVVEQYENACMKCNHWESCARLERGYQPPILDLASEREFPTVKCVIEQASPY